MLCSWLFGYKFALICVGVVLMLNLIIIIIIIIIVIKKKKLSNLTQPDPCGLGWVGFFLTYHAGLGWKTLQPDQCTPLIA